MKTKFTRVASLLCALIMLTAIVNAQNVIHYWDFNQTEPATGIGADSLGTAYSYTATIHNDSVNKTFPLYPSYTTESGARILVARPTAKQGGASKRDSIVDNGAGGSYVNDLPIAGNDSNNGNQFVRMRNPSLNAYVYLYMPTTGYNNIVLNYALTASSSSGAPYNVFSYSTNGGSSWNNLTKAMDTFNVSGVYMPDTLLATNSITDNSIWYPVKIDFSSDPNVNNNPNFIVRWTYLGSNATKTSGNDRYDNFSLSGDSLCPRFTVQPVSTIQCGSSGNGSASFWVRTLGGASVTYQWLVNTGGGFTGIGLGGGYTGYNTDSLIITNTNKTMNGYQYECVVNNPSCGTLISNSATLTVDSAVTASIATSTNISCGGNGTATASGAGGTTPYTYSWSNSQTTVTATNLAAGTYTVTVTDLYGCSGTSSVTIVDPGVVSVGILSSTNVECGAYGSATAQASSGTSPYTYSWSDAESTSTATALTPGTYTVTAEDHTGCTASTTVTISQILQLRDSVNAQKSVIHYWDFNQTPPLTGGGGDSLGSAFSYAHPYGSVHAFSGSTDSLNNTATLYAPYTVLPATPGYILYSIPQGKQGGASTTDGILDNGSGGAYVNDLPLLGNDSSVVIPGKIIPDTTVINNVYVRSRNPDENAYMYLHMPTTGYNNVVLNYALSASSVKGATYNVFSYSTNGGASWNNLTKAMDTFNLGGVYRPDTLLATNPTTIGSNWYPVQINFSSDPSVNNNPNFVVRWQFEGSTSTGSSGNDRYDNISLSGNAITEACSGGNNVTAVAGVKYGATPYTYIWTPNVSSTGIASNLSAGTYKVTVRDAMGCSSSSSITVTQPAVLSATASALSSACSGDANGSAKANPSNGTAPYTYLWSPGGSTSSTATGLSAGSYTVTVGDHCGASVTAQVTVNQFSAMTLIAFAGANVSCYGGSNGQAKVSTSGGRAPYTYSWSPVTNSTYIAGGLSAGSYSVVLTDFNGCSATSAVTITQPTALMDSVATVSYPSCVMPTGSATIGVQGGTSPYRYTWSPNISTTNSATGLLVRSYAVQVKDNNGCWNTLNFSISQPPLLRDSIVKGSVINASPCGSNGGATVGVKYGTSPYTYSWSSAGGSGSTANGLSAGTYTVTVNDAGLCTASTSVTIIQVIRPSLLATAYTGGNVSCNGGSNGQAKVSVTGGSTPYTYSWNSGSNTYIANGLSIGTYTVTVTDNCGSSASSSATVSQPALLVDSVASITYPPCPGEEAGGIASPIPIGGTAVVGVIGGTSPYRYTWSPNVSSTDSASGLTTRSYVVQVKDNNNCWNELTFPVTCITPLVAATYKGNETSCCPVSDNINLYPNPNTGQFSLSGLQKGMILEMYDYTGKKISAMTTTNETMQLNISQADGVYLIRILDKDGNLVSQKKIVKVQ